MTWTRCLDTFEVVEALEEGGTVDPDSRGRKPRWPIVVGIVAVAFLGLMIALHLSGGLGPGLH